MTVITSSSDNFLYDRIINLLKEVKLVQGGTALASTLRRHKKIKDYCIAKQIVRINHIEDDYFLSDGSLNTLSIQEFNQKSTLQNN